MKRGYLLLALLMVTSLSVQIVEARSGCCSHHDGVCGCGCCDGTPLSATCAPYYPECNGGYNDPSPTPKAPVRPVCQANAQYVGGSCVCNDGYAMFGTACIKIPPHAHATGSNADAWECDTGYQSSEYSCVPVVQAAVATNTQPTSSTTDTEGNPAAGGVMLLAIVGGVYWFIRRRRMKKAAALSGK